MTHIALRTANGTFLTAAGGGGGTLMANAFAAKEWETFELIDRGNNRISLKTSNGHYVCAEGGGGREMVANREVMLDWETFELIDRGNNKISLKASDGHYICAEGGGGREVVANREVMLDWETFERIEVTPKTTLAYKDLEIAFATQFESIWDDRGSGANENIVVYRPVPMPGYYAVGHLALSHIDYNYNPSSNRVMAVVKDRSGTALKPPTGYEFIWKDSGSGAEKDVSIWRPIPPTGYLAMGLVCNAGHDAPALDIIRCVRNDLVAPGSTGDDLWKDEGSGADIDFSAWTISPVEASEGQACFSAGTFIGRASREKPPTDAAANVFKIAIEVTKDGPSKSLPKPILRDTNSPSPFEIDSVVSITKLPWFAVRDPGLTDVERLSKSPVYTLERKDRYKRIYHNHNDTQLAQNPTIHFTEGFNESETATFTETVGVKFETKWKIGASFEASMELSRSFTEAHANTKGSMTSTTRDFPVIAAPGTAVAVYTVQSTFRLFRADGALVGSAVTADKPDSIYYTQYPALGTLTAGGGTGK